MKKRVKSRKPNTLRKRAARGFRGLPMATVAFYGPDNMRASKVAVGIVDRVDGEPIALERWFSKDGDVRQDAQIGKEIEDLLKLYGVKSVGLTDTIIGCPHQEGKDYPEGEVCPQCPFWANRDRFTHEEYQ